MAWWVEPLLGEVVGVVGPLPGGARPVEDRAAARLADLLLVLVECFMRPLFPEERQVARHRHEALGDRLPAREVDRPVVTVIARSGQVALNRRVGEVAGRDHVRHHALQVGRRLAGLRQVNFEE